MSWRNIIENSIQLVIVFLGLGIYTNIVLKPILITAIETETTKIENNIKTDIDNKFKKIDKLQSSLNLKTPVDNNQENNQKQDCVLSINDFNALKDSDKRRIKKILDK